MADSTAQTSDRIRQFKYLDRTYGIKKCPVCKLDIGRGAERCPYCGCMLTI